MGIALLPVWGLHYYLLLIPSRELGGFPKEATHALRFDLTDAPWGRIQPFFPDRYHHGQAGHPWKDHRPLVHGILWHLHTGAPWPDTPACYGPWQTVYDRFNRWRKDGTWARILDALLLHLDRDSFIGRDLVVLRRHQQPHACLRRRDEKKSRARAPAGRCGGDASGGVRRPGVRSFARRLPHQDASGLRWPRHPAGGRGDGRAAPCKQGFRAGNGAGPASPTSRPAGRAGAGAGDKGYSYSPVRRWRRRHHVEPVIPTRKDQPREEDFDKET